MLVFKHPKFYEELRKKAKKFQKEERERNAKEQATSVITHGARLKLQAASDKLPDFFSSIKFWQATRVIQN